MTILRSGSASDVGRVRSVNEDQALEGVTLFAVADGMGGHAGGDVAAQTAVRALEQRFALQPSPNGLVQAVRDANTAVWERSNDDPDLRGMGTTLTTVGLVNTGEGDHLVLANVGDSRAYRLRAGALEQLTVDHSVAQELVTRGELSSAEAEVHPHRHILTRALGVGPDVDVDVWEVVPEKGDRLVLCSDGLTNEVPDEGIEEVLASTPDPGDAAQALVDRANAAGGNDNITVVVVDVLVAEDAPGPAEAGVSAAADAGSRPVGEGAVGAAVIGAAVMGAGGPSTVASATIPAGLLGAPPADTSKAAKPAKVPRRDRPRRPRRITFRVLFFIVLVGALAFGAWTLVHWYANHSYFVALDPQGSLSPDAEVVVYQGRPGGVLGIEPKVVFRSDVTLAQIPQAAKLVFPNVQDTNGVQEQSLMAAIAYVQQLKCQANLVAPASAPVFPGQHCPTTPVPTTTSTTPGTTTSTSRALGLRTAMAEPWGTAA